MRDLGDEKVTVAISSAILQILPVENADQSTSTPCAAATGNDECEECAALQAEVCLLLRQSAKPW